MGTLFETQLQIPQLEAPIFNSSTASQHKIKGMKFEIISFPQ